MSTTIPLLPCTSPAETVEFFTALGFTATYEQTRPYLYLSFTLGDVELHFGQPPSALDPDEERSGGALVMTDDVAGYHRAFTAALRSRYGRVLAAGRPRITRFRAGQTRFTAVDPSGNRIMFISRDEPTELDYGGASTLTGLAKVIDNARILRDFKTDPVLAARALDAGLRRHRDGAPPGDLVRALAHRAELAIALGDEDLAAELAADLEAVLRTSELSDLERAGLDGELRAADELQRWLSD